MKTNSFDLNIGIWQFLVFQGQFHDDVFKKIANGYWDGGILVANLSPTEVK